MVSFSGAGSEVPPAGPYRKGAEQQEPGAKPLPREWLRQEHIGEVQKVEVKKRHVSISTTFDADPIKTGDGSFDTKNRIWVSLHMERAFSDQAVEAIGKKLKITIEPVYEGEEL